MNGTNNKTKNPHYVPVMYLKNFSIIPTTGKKKTRRAKIHFFNKIERGEIQRSSTGAECVKPFFYDQIIESLLNNKIETNLLNDTFQKIIEEFSLDDLTLKQFNDIKLFILGQTNRTEYRMRYYQELISWAKKQPEDVYNKSLDVVFSNNLPSQNELSSSGDFLKEMVKNDILMAIKRLSIMKDFSWIMYKNHTHLPFYTSDNPVINKSEIFFRFNKVKIQTGQFKERIYVLPISPKIILKLSKPINSEFKYKIMDEIVNDKMKIIMYNNEIMRNAETKVYMREKYDPFLQHVISFDNKCLERKSYIRLYLPKNKMGKYKVDIIHNNNP